MKLQQTISSSFIALFVLAYFSAFGQSVSHPEQVVYELFRTTDEHRWSDLANVFADEVVLDYSSMTGQPAERLSPSTIVRRWRSVLPGFDHTHHQLGNVTVQSSGDKAKVFAYGTAQHYLIHQDGNLWTVVGTYEFELIKEDGDYRVNKMTFHQKYQDGNTELINHAITQLNQKNLMKKVTFTSEGLDLSGHLYLPADYEAGKQYPAVVVSGSWTTVKEQMAGTYAEHLAKQGFVALAFDFRNFGESEGEPRFYESPALKKDDIKNAVTYLQSLDEVDGDRIGAFGVCAGAMYTVMAAAEDDRIQSVVTTASWLHDAEAVKLFYGGEEGVAAKINAARTAKQHYAQTGEVTYIPTISETDESAAMYGPYDYYLNPERGAIDAWSADKFAVASWEDWLTTDPMPTASKIKQPILMIHSDGAVLPDYTKTYFERIASTEKRLHWMDTDMESPYHQFSYYDQEAEVTASVAEASAWLKKM